MIGRLKGIVDFVGTDTAILDVGGVGYEFSATSRTLSRLSSGEHAELAIETLVAETYIKLVGFESEAERRTFRLLQTVQGVGAKAALAILQVLSPSELMDAVAVGNKTAVSRAQGVGPKLAQRVVTELKGKTTGLLGAELAATAHSLHTDIISEPQSGGHQHDAISALINLGYDENTARRAVASVTDAEATSVESIITASLKGMSGS